MEVYPFKAVFLERKNAFHYSVLRKTNFSPSTNAYVYFVCNGNYLLYSDDIFAATYAKIEVL